MKITYAKLDQLDRLGYGAAALQIAEQSGVKLYRAAALDGPRDYYWYIEGLRSPEGAEGLGSKQRAAIVYCYERDVAFKILADDITP